MAIVTLSARNDGIANSVCGSFTADGSAQTLTCGFLPTYIMLVNETDVIKWEKFAPMVAANTIKTVAAGTMTLDTGSAIVFNADQTITLSATLAASGKAIKFRAMRS